jgi:hypothetical protein
MYLLTKTNNWDHLIGKGELKMWETLPFWFWIVYYLFLITTFGTCIFSFVKGKIKALSVIAMVIALTVPIVSLVNSMGRAEGMNSII